MNEQIHEALVFEPIIWQKPLLEEYLELKALENTGEYLPFSNYENWEFRRWHRFQRRQRQHEGVAWYVSLVCRNSRKYGGTLSSILGTATVYILNRCIGIFFDPLKFNLGLIIQNIQCFMGSSR